MWVVRLHAVRKLTILAQWGTGLSQGWTSCLTVQVKKGVTTSLVSGGFIDGSSKPRLDERCKINTMTVSSYIQPSSLCQETWTLRWQEKWKETKPNCWNINILQALRGPLNTGRDAGQSFHIATVIYCVVDLQYIFNSIQFKDEFKEVQNSVMSRKFT